MQDRLTIATPDHVQLELELAGPGSRFAALFIDWLILAALIFFLVLTLGLGGVFASGFAAGGEGVSVFVALLILFFFLLYWGYFIFFETLMRGQTPGKRMAGIRVLRDNGLPIGIREAAIRNLLRIADIQPAPSYILGGLVAIYHPMGKRLGDMAAGSIVVRERFDMASSSESQNWSARWVAKLERGESRHALTLPTGKVSVRQLAMMEQFLARAERIQPEQRAQLAWRMAAPHFSVFGIDARSVRDSKDAPARCEEIIAKILEMAREPEQGAVGEAREKTIEERAGQDKNRLWTEFSQKTQGLLQRGAGALAQLTPNELATLLDSHRRITTDLARAQAMDADHQTLDRLNRLAVAGHNLLYRHARPRIQRTSIRWFSIFAREVRRHAWAVALAGALLFLPALISYFAIQINHELAYSLVSGGFLDFKPASEENLHNIPELARPIAASSIMTNNVQVTLLCFGLGLSMGLGTALILIFNGVHLGAIAGWMAVNGDSRALWGWIMPHGGTELLAIVLAGAAGFMLARALIAPGRFRRTVALKQIAFKALIIELGCMAMLVVAGLIEGFVSPSAISYPTRIAILVGSLAIWLVYFCFAGGAVRIKLKR